MQNHFKTYAFSCVSILLAHLSRRFTRRAYRIGVERMSVCLSVCVCLYVHTFKHKYLCNQWADRNQILSKASLRGGGGGGGWKGCTRFWARSDQTLVSMGTHSSNGIIKGEIWGATLVPSFLIGSSSLAGNEDNQKISTEFEFRPDPTTDDVSCP